jgi:hypothetical protein
MGDSLPAVQVGTGRTVTQFVPGVASPCVRLDNLAVKCWGYNSFGQLGQGDTFHRGDNAGEMGDVLAVTDLGTGRTATSLFSGDSYHTCAILDDLTTKCWGRNGDGQLGLGDTNGRGDAAGEMGNSLPAVNVGTGRTVRTMGLGIVHTCAILDNGAVKCWGNNFYGQLGYGDTNNRGDGPNEMGDNLANVQLAAPTAAGLSVSGRVLTPDGRGLRNARVTIIDASGKAFTVATGSLGTFSFSDMTAGQSYIVYVTANKYSYAPRQVLLTQAIDDLAFIP